MSDTPNANHMIGRVFHPKALRSRRIAVGEDGIRQFSTIVKRRLREGSVHGVKVDLFAAKLVMRQFAKSEATERARLQTMTVEEIINEAYRKITRFL